MAKNAIGKRASEKQLSQNNDGGSIMLKKISDFLGGTLMTAVGGVFLMISLVLMLTDTYFPVDPAWVSYFGVYRI